MEGLILSGEVCVRACVCTHGPVRVYTWARACVHMDPCVHLHTGTRSLARGLLF